MKVVIKCKGSSNLKLDELIPFQGDLKSLSDENYKRLKDQIFSLGFIAPFHIWSHCEGKERADKDLLDGHQRLKTLLQMRDKEKIAMPDEFPIVEIDASSYQKAKEAVLAISSQYGEISEDGIRNFIADTDITLEDVSENFHFDAVSLNFVDPSGDIDIVDNINLNENFIIVCENNEEIKKVRKFFGTDKSKIKYFNHKESFYA